MKTLAERVIKARIHKGLSQPQLAALIPMKQQSLYAIEKGETKNPRFMEKLAKTLEVSEEWLKYGINPPTWLPEYQYPIELGLIPLVSLDKVGKSGKVEEKTTTYLSFNNPNLIAVQVRGNAMVSMNEPRLSLYEGDTVIVDKEAKPQHGDIVLAIQKGEEEAILRNYSVEGKKINLIPLDTKN